VSEAWIRRYQALGDAACSNCPTACKAGALCAGSRTNELRPYNGIRITNDGNDCALQVVIDSHSHCSYGCAYCFSENSFGHVRGRDLGLGQTSLREIDAIFTGTSKRAQRLRRALRYDNLNEKGFPAPVQLGGINDPGDNIERQQGWLLRFIRLMIKRNQPVRISTKGTVLLDPAYQREIAKAPHLFWFLVSIVSPDEELSAKVERWVPPPKERIKVIKAMTELGCFAGLRFRPVIPGMSDATPRYPRAYETLIHWAADAGAKSIEYEILYAPMRFHGEQRKRWDKMERDIGVPVRDAYKKMGRTQASLRPSAAWSEQIVNAIYEVAKSRGMVVGCSEPAWKELNDDGCCCGMLRTHPVFGNWEPRNATAALVNARDSGKLVTLDDVTPEWAHEWRMSEVCNIGATGPRGAYDKRHLMYSDFIERDWHNGNSVRNPEIYFQGALKRDGDGFRFHEQSRRHPESTPYWTVER
jgi:DNA repair photolyase